jgi:hypothetical protein
MNILFRVLEMTAAFIFLAGFGLCLIFRNVTNGWKVWR